MAAAGLGTTEPLEEAGEEAEALEAVKMLLDLGADINAVDSNGDTAMHGAAYGAYPTVVKLLAERGADPQSGKRKTSSAGRRCSLPRATRGGSAARCSDDRCGNEVDARRRSLDRRRTAANRGHLREDARAHEDDQNRETLEKGKGQGERECTALTPLPHPLPLAP